MNDREPRVFHTVRHVLCQFRKYCFCVLILGEALFQMSDRLEFAEGVEGKTVLSQIKMVSSRREEELG